VIEILLAHITAHFEQGLFKTGEGNLSQSNSQEIKDDEKL